MLARQSVELRGIDPDLQQLFLDSRDRVRALEAEGRTVDDSSLHVVTEELRTSRHDLDLAIERIQRTSPDFMATRSGGQVAIAAAPLAYLFATEAGCASLIVTGQSELSAEHFVRLDELTSLDLAEILVSHDANGGIAGGYLIARQRPNPENWQLTLDTTLHLLGKAVMRPLVRRAVELGLKHLTLVPTGLFSVLPLHAACIAQHRDASESPCEPVLDSIEISYAPSASVQGVAQQNASRSVLTVSLLAVTTSGIHEHTTTNLPFADTEIRSILSQFDDTERVLLRGSDATLLGVKNGARQANILHFACHGWFNYTDTLASGLVLTPPDTLTTSDVLMSDVFGRCRLAVLSGCETGMSDYGALSDEVLGLPMGFLQAGVPGVIGSLWSVNDLSTALLMRKFYELLLPDVHSSERSFLRTPAAALREAQQWLRSTTAGELGLDMLWNEIYLASGGTDALAQREMRYYRARPEVKPFTHPYYWAPFIAVGS
jgi:CHAT domain-containing protein